MSRTRWLPEVKISETISGFIEMFFIVQLYSKVKQVAFVKKIIFIVADKDIF